MRFQKRQQKIRRNKKVYALNLDSAIMSKVLGIPSFNVNDSLFLTKKET
jgi:hypothetical protein